MRALIATLIILVLSIRMTAQSEASGNLLMVGDTLLVSTDMLPSNRRIARPTTGNYWNFRSLQAPFTRMVVVRVNNSDHIPGEMIIGTFDATDKYIEVDRNGDMWITALRVRSGTSDMTGIVEGKLPYRLNRVAEGDTLDFSGSIRFERAVDFEGGDLLNADSVRVSFDWDYRVSRDEEGEIDLESGLYEATRYSALKTVEMVPEARINRQWVVLADAPVNAVPRELYSGLTYSWWSSNVPEPLAVVEADKYGIAQEVTFRASPLAARRVIDKVPVTPDIFVHPNPTFGFVRFEMVNLPRDSYKIEIFSIIGAKIREIPVDVNGRFTLPADFSDLKRGTYIYRLVNSSQKTIRSKRLVIIQP